MRTFEVGVVTAGRHFQEEVFQGRPATAWSESLTEDLSMLGLGRPSLPSGAHFQRANHVVFDIADEELP